MQIIRPIVYILYRTVISNLPSNNYIFIGIMFKKIRYWAVKCLFKRVGKNVNIEKKVMFDYKNQIEIGDNSGIGENNIIGPYTTIGNDVMMGKNISIYPRNHNMDNINIPLRLQGYTEYTHIVIKNNVWIGSNVSILSKVKIIEEGAVIGTGTILTKNVDKNAVVAGNPCRLIKYRT